jgi:hypothetical protein
METPFTQLNLRGIEHVWVEYHVAKSFLLSSNDVKESGDSLTVLGALGT